MSSIAPRRERRGAGNENCQGWRVANGLRGTSTAYRLRRGATLSAAAPGLRQDRREAWLRGTLGQRPPPVLSPVARRPDGPVLRTCGQRTDGPYDHGGAPVVRGPVALAKSMAAIDILCAGRLIVGVGPGSSASDYEAVGLPFEERWKRLDEAVEA